MPARRKKREVVEEKKFVKLVKSHGWICYKLSMVGPFGEAGLNDRVVFAAHGITALFEFKKEGEEPGPLQAYRHRVLKKLSHRSYVVYKSDAAFKILKRLVADAESLHAHVEESIRAIHRRDEAARKARRRKASSVST